MDSASLDLYTVYKRYCEIKSREYAYINHDYTAEDEPNRTNYAREELLQLLTLVESIVNSRSLFCELSKLKSKIELMLDFSEFSRFYDFVFFACRENGQRNVTVIRAVMAWRLVLAGRFRLLHPWCEFVEKYQRHNISEDTWRQVLAFSRCVHENLEGYDSTGGAWPILIDDFVEHMYSIRGSACNSVNSTDSSFNFVSSEGQDSLEEPLHGLKINAGSKRKPSDDFMVKEACKGSESFAICPSTSYKRRQCCSFSDSSMKHDCMEISKHSCNSSNSAVGCGKVVCAVEGCLSKGFAGLFSGRSCLQFGGHGSGLRGSVSNM